MYRQDKAKAVEILVQDLRVFSTFNEDLYKEITQLLTLQNFRYDFVDSTSSVQVEIKIWVFSTDINRNVNLTSNDIKQFDFLSIAGKMTSFPNTETLKQLGP